MIRYEALCSTAAYCIPPSHRCLSQPLCSAPCRVAASLTFCTLFKEGLPCLTCLQEQVLGQPGSISRAQGYETRSKCSRCVETCLTIYLLGILNSTRARTSDALLNSNSKHQQNRTRDHPQQTPRLRRHAPLSPRHRMTRRTGWSDSGRAWHV